MKESTPMTKFELNRGTLHSLPTKSPADLLALMASYCYRIICYDIPPEPQNPIDPCQELAASVILQAVYDMRHAVKSKDRESAKHFLLKDTDWFPYWCHAANIDPKVVREALTKEFKNEAKPSRNLTRHTYKQMRSLRSDTGNRVVPVLQGAA